MLRGANSARTPSSRCSGVTFPRTLAFLVLCRELRAHSSAPAVCGAGPAGGFASRSTAEARMARRLALNYHHALRNFGHGPTRDFDMRPGVLRIGLLLVMLSGGIAAQELLPGQLLPGQVSSGAKLP